MCAYFFSVKSVLFFPSKFLPFLLTYLCQISAKFIKAEGDGGCDTVSLYIHIVHVCHLLLHVLHVTVTSLSMLKATQISLVHGTQRAVS